MTDSIDASPAERAASLLQQLLAHDKQATWPATAGRDAVDWLLSADDSAEARTRIDPLVAFAVGWVMGRGDIVNDLVEPFYLALQALPPAAGVRWARRVHAHLELSYSRRLPLPDWESWPEAMMTHAQGNGRQHGRGSKATNAYSARHLEAMLESQGIDPATLVVAAFATSLDQHPRSAYGLREIAFAADFPDALDRHLERIRAHVVAPGGDQGEHVLRLLAGARAETLARLAPELASFVAHGTKQVRKMAEPLLERAGGALVEPIRAIARGGKPDARALALRWLAAHAARTGDAALRAFARETAAADKAASVRALADEWAAGESAAVPAAPSAVEIDWSPAANRIPDDALAAFWREAETGVEAMARNTWGKDKRLLGLGLEQGARTAADAAALRAFLAAPGLAPPPRILNPADMYQAFSPALRAHVVPVATPAALAKVLVFFGALVHDGSFGHAAVELFGVQREQQGRPSLDELMQIARDAGKPADALVRNLVDGVRSGPQLAGPWPAAQLQPYAEQHADAIAHEILEPPRFNSWNYDRERLFASLEKLQALPAPVTNALLALALGTNKTDRPAAQRVLAARPGSAERFVAALADAKADTRALAALWLARQRHAPALAALEKAIDKEKHDFAKAALLEALEALGQPVGKYIARDALAADAAKALAKELSPDVAWFPFDALPAVHWASDGAPVDGALLRWLLAQAVRQKSAEPNALLRRLASMFVDGEREAFGQFVLETWLREDIEGGVPIQYAYADQPKGTAIGSKGLLAIAAACAGREAAPTTKAYLDRWYGNRPSQGKTLIAMLAWIDHPSATQLLLAIGRRFRTRSFQEEAMLQIEALAERKGWSVAELADRTIPTAGFDESGTLELDFGSRVFKATLQPDFKLVLRDPEGKAIAALPEPRAGDDAESATEAKKAFAAAKKEVKTIVALQTERLLDAFCTQRVWPAADWRGFLLVHPVVRHLVQRLVWNALDAEGRVVHTFRPLDDGTLTDLDDAPVQLADDARVQLAHDSTLPADAVQAWLAHLADYDAAPLFVQLGRGMYTLPAQLAKATALDEFSGWVVEAFALRGRATRLGWSRGPNDDGAYFSTYERRFTSLGLRAVVEFSGNELPEKNLLVAVLNLSFSAIADERGQPRALSTIPPVLLSECRHDLAAMAASGSGYDADWQNKVGR